MKTKSKLSELKVKSFLTSVDHPEWIKGGASNQPICNGTGANCPISGIVQCIPTYRYPCP